MSLLVASRAFNLMNYQLVIQLDEALYGDLDWIAEVEERLDDALSEGYVDGHDIGSGELNLFIHVNDLQNTFSIVKTILEEEGVNLKNVTIAYREISAEGYIVLWPKDLEEFKII